MSDSLFSNQSWQRHVQLRSALGACQELAKARHIERYPRSVMRAQLALIEQCLNDIDMYEEPQNKEQGINEN